MNFYKLNKGKDYGNFSTTVYNALFEFFIKYRM